MSDLREKRRLVSLLFPVFRWWSVYFRQPVFPGYGNEPKHEGSHRLLFFCVSLMLHAVAIFSLAATPSPKKARAIEVTLLGPSPFSAFGQVSSPEQQEGNVSPLERKASPRARKESREARMVEAESTAKAMTQSLAQPGHSENTTPPAMAGEGESQSTEARGSGQPATGLYPGDGSANPGTDDHTLSQYLRLVRERIGSCKKYPFIARKRALEGEVGVRFLLTGAGEAQRLVVSRSSGQEILDRAALRAVEDGTPFPRPPAGLLAEPITIELNVVFNLS